MNRIGVAILAIAIAGCDHTFEIKGLDQPTKNIENGLKGVDPFQANAIRVDQEEIARLKAENRALRQSSTPVQVAPTVSQLAGGRGGSPFQDQNPNGLRITAIRVRAAARVDSLQAVIRGVATVQHGGNGGTFREIKLGDGEYVTGISGHAGARIDSITINTNKRKLSFGGSGGSPFSHMAPDGHEVVGFVGRSARELDAVGIISRPVQ